MKVLVSGASGYIGRAVARKLVDEGHDVIGTARSDTAARTLRAQGIKDVFADLDNPGSLIAATKGVDAVIETASADHALSTTTFLNELEGSGRAYIRTSGSAIYSDMSGGAHSDLAHTEDDRHQAVPVLASRFASDLETIDAADRRVNTVVIRPSMIYGYGASEQLPTLLRAALRHKFSGYSGEGLNRYGNVYVDDLADVYARALENGPAGSVYNIAAAEETLKAIAESIGRIVDVPVRSFIDEQEATTVLGSPLWVGALGSNSRIDSTKARTELGWKPIGPDLLSDIEQGSYRLWRTAPPTVVAPS